jgi:PPOX class probable F420-dependent enzyme
MIDLNTDYGKRVQRRLENERIAWLTTVSESGKPCPRPIWFLWDGETLLVYSRPNTHKLRHIANNHNVAVNLDGDGLGGDIVVLQGLAKIEPDAPPADQVEAYTTKYEEGLKRIGMTGEEFASDYSVALKVTPHSLRGH